MPGYRTIAILTLASGLASCSSYGYYKTSSGTYQATSSAMTAAPAPLADAGSTRPNHRKPRRPTADQPAESADTVMPATRVGGPTSMQEPTSLSKPALPPDHKPSPLIGTPEWQREQAQNQQRDREIDRAIRSICQGC
jgi:hypothetical protein